MIDLLKIKKHVDEALKILEYFPMETMSSEKFNEQLEKVMIQFEYTTIELRRLCEENQMPVKHEKSNIKIYHAKEIYGSIEITDNGWLHICLNTLLPNCKSHTNSIYISDSITRLIDRFIRYGGALPFYEKAFLAIIERCNLENRKSFDHDNKGFKAIQNALKGRLFADDNQFSLSLGLFTEIDDEIACHIYVMPENETADFFYLRHGDGL